MADIIVTIAKDPVKERLKTSLVNIRKRPPMSGVATVVSLRLRVSELEAAIEDILDHLGMK